MLKLNLEIQDPRASDAPQLLALAALFTALASGNKADQVRGQLADATLGAARSERTVGFRQENTVGGQVVGAGALDPADNPERGLPSPAEAFGTSMGNGAAGSGSASFPSLASTGADSTSASQAQETGAPSAPAVSLPDPETAFGGSAGNVPSTPPAGTPPAQNNGSQTAGASTQASGGVELDAEGIPWDASIHASTRAKLVNGNWKLKRGVGETYVLERKALLRQALTAGNAPGGAPATPPANVPVPPPAGAGAPVPPPPPASGSVGNVIPTAPALPPTTPGAAGSSTVTLAQVLPRVTAAMAAGLLTPDSAAAVVRELSDGKIDNVAMLAVAPALIPQFVARLDALGIPA